VLRDVPDSLHVRLYGPREARVERAMEAEGIAREEAGRRLDDNDRAREAYVHHFYGADANDLRHYQLAIDTTAMSLDRVVDLVARAVERD
jgi:cytidylate kinase